MVHVVQGAIALALLLAGVEWIVRTRLVSPLARIAHQVRFMGNGGGWAPALPEADAELVEVENALESFGPALHGQVAQWIEAERRAAVASALSSLRGKMRAPHTRALALLGDLQARNHITPEGKPRLRALVGEMEALTASIRELEQEVFSATPASTHEASP